MKDYEYRDENGNYLDYYTILEETKKKLKIEANDIKDRIEDLTNCYKKGTVDEIIEQQKKDLEKIRKQIKKLERLI